MEEEPKGQTLNVVYPKLFSPNTDSQTDSFTEPPHSPSRIICEQTTPPSLRAYSKSCNVENFEAFSNQRRTPTHKYETSLESDPDLSLNTTPTIKRLSPSNNDFGSERRSILRTSKLLTQRSSTRLFGTKERPNVSFAKEKEIVTFQADDGCENKNSVHSSSTGSISSTRALIQPGIHHVLLSPVSEQNQESICTDSESKEDLSNNRGTASVGVKSVKSPLKQTSSPQSSYPAFQFSEISPRNANVEDIRNATPYANGFASPAPSDASSTWAFPCIDEVATVVNCSGSTSKKADVRNSMNCMVNSPAPVYRFGRASWLSESPATSISNSLRRSEFCHMKKKNFEDDKMDTDKTLKAEEVCENITDSNKPFNTFTDVCSLKISENQIDSHADSASSLLSSIDVKNLNIDFSKEIENAGDIIAPSQSLLQEVSKSESMLKSPDHKVSPLFSFRSYTNADVLPTTSNSASRFVPAALTQNQQRHTVSFDHARESSSNTMNNFENIKGTDSVPPAECVIPEGFSLYNAPEKPIDVPSGSLSPFSSPPLSSSSSLSSSPLCVRSKIENQQLGAAKNERDRQSQKIVKLELDKTTRKADQEKKNQQKKKKTSYYARVITA